MSYVGIATQQSRNNIKSILLLISFPLLLLLLLYTGCLMLTNSASEAMQSFLANTPLLLIGVLLWFCIAYFTNVKIIDSATGAQPLNRSENKRVYNLVENLCIANGLQMPKIHIINDESLNAFASGVSKKSYTITLTKGIINRLDDKELESVIAHELAHIKNNDVRVLIISIVFVGIFSLLSQIALRVFFFGGRRNSRSSKNSSGGTLVVMTVVLLLAIIGYFISILMRFAISRNREYLADAGAAMMTKNPPALASALRKISGNSNLSKKQSETVAQLFIEHDPDKNSFLSSIFATHPPIAKRIKILEQF